MTTESLKDVILRTVMEVLEQSAFVFPEPGDMLEGVAFDNFEFILVTLKFTGDREGEGKMILPAEFCAELAANLLGEDMDQSGSDESSFDSAKEVFNIITGQFLTRMFGDRALFSLTAPEVHQIDREQVFEIFNNQDFAFCMVDEYPILAMFQMKEEQVNEHQGSGR